MGTRFGKTGGPAILLVGESHYLPKDSTQHLDPEEWYGGSEESLNPQEKEWIDTAAIFHYARSRNFGDGPFRIWRNSLEVINENGPRFPRFEECADHVAACNFFLRPAKYRESLSVCEQDVTIANEAMQRIFGKLRPTAVAFLSRKAFSFFEVQTNLPCVSTPHPGTQWWNRVSKRYGNRKGRELLAEFVGRMEW